MQEGNLHKWFKGSKSKDGKSGWVNVVTGGTCASDKPGEGTPKCVSSSKRASMTPAERKSAQRRKKAADPNQQSKSGAAKPTYVSTDKPKKKMKEEMEINEADKKGKSSGKKDACYHKVKASASVWPSAYASGRLVQCRKKGAANYGKSKKNEEFMALPEFTDLQIRCMEAAGIEVEVLDKKAKVVLKGSSTFAGGDAAKPGKDKNYVKPMATEEKEESKVGGGNLKKLTAKAVRRIDADVDGDVDTDDMKSSETGEFVPSPDGKKKLKPKVRFEQSDWKSELEEAPKYDKKGLDKFDRSKRMIRHKQDKYGASTLKQSIMTGANHNIDNEKKAKMKKEEVEIEEATRVPAQNGNVYLVGFTWRGKYMMMKLFFPEVKRPSRNEVKNALEKIYPGCHLQRFDLAPYNPSEPMINVGVSEEVHTEDISPDQNPLNNPNKNAEYRQRRQKVWQIKTARKHTTTNMEEVKKKYCPKCEKVETREECKYGGAYWDKYATEKFSEAIFDEENVSLKMGKHKSRTGGLTKAGREKYNRATGSNLQAPQPEGGARKDSFCARMGGVEGPMKKPNGEPTRKALALKKWKC